MQREDIEALLPELQAFHQRFGQYFCRTEGRLLSEKYLMGLTLPIERKNVENLAEQVGVSTRVLQRFVTESPWDDQGCISELQKLVGEGCGSKDGVLILGDTGFAKKGQRSAGVGRQYSGTLGRTDNCQIGVFLSYASRKGHTLVDRRLYLMKQWFGAEASERRRWAGVPDNVQFHTKLELGMEMVKAADAAGHLPYEWVTGDAAYGDCHDLRTAVEELQKLYCFEVSSTSAVWLTPPEWKVPAGQGPRGRRRTRAKPTTASSRSQTVASVAADPHVVTWIRHRVQEGAKGPREYEFARVRVIEKRHRRPGSEGWLMLRRPVGGGEVKYYLSNAPEDTPLETMAHVGCLRWTIEENFELAKGEVGLDHYEVTQYRGWYNHITMSMMALAFLKQVQWKWGKKITRQRSRDTRVAPRRSPRDRVDCGHSYCVASPSTAA